MKEGAKSLAQLHAERMLFVEEAMQEDAHKDIPLKTADIGLMYTFSDELTLDDIATQVYPQDKSGRANTSKHYRRFMKILFGRASHALGSQYEIDDLLAKRPMPQKSREKSSEAHGGATLKIRDLICSGTKSVDELEKQLRLPRGKILSGLRALERWRIDVSQFTGKIRESGKKIQQLITEMDDKKIQEIMDGLPSTVILYNITEHRRRKRERKKRRYPKVFTTIGSVTSGVYHNKYTEIHLFAQVLKKDGIPNRRVKIAPDRKKPLVYYVFLEKHRDRALAAWKKNRKLEKFKTNPVRIVCGSTNADVPSIIQLHGEEYRSVYSVLSDLRIRISSRHLREFREWLFEGCPTTVWAYREGRYIAASDADSFKKYFSEKWKEKLEEEIRRQNSNIAET